MSTKELERLILEKQAKVRAIIASWDKLEEEDGAETVEAGSAGDDSGERPSSG